MPNDSKSNPGTTTAAQASAPSAPSTPSAATAKSAEAASASNPADSATHMAEAAFSKPPALGSIAWLYARTPDKRFLFLGDMDWAVVSALMVDQCRLFFKAKMSVAFVTWAQVGDEVNQRLLEGNPKLAPHEWKSGSHQWLIDVVTPLGGLQEVLEDVQKNNFAGERLQYLAPSPLTKKLEVTVYTGAAKSHVMASPDVSQIGQINQIRPEKIVH